MALLGDDRDNTVDLMLFEDGFIDANSFVSEKSLTQSQQFEYERVSRDLERVSVEFIKETIQVYLRQLVNRIRLVRKFQRTGLSLEGSFLDLAEPLEVDPTIEVEFAVRPTLAILEDLTDVERLKQYLLTLRLVDFRIPTLRPSG